jgi:hypothetical protein
MFYGCSALVRTRGPIHVGLLVGKAAIVVLSVALAALGVSVALCLVVMVPAPATTVVGYETLGRRQVSEALERL